jgi:hypothetical protein
MCSPPYLPALSHTHYRRAVVRSVCVVYIYCLNPTGAWLVYVILRFMQVLQDVLSETQQDNFLMRQFKHVERLLTTCYSVEGKTTNRRHVLSRK